MKITVPLCLAAWGLFVSMSMPAQAAPSLESLGQQLGNIKQAGQERVRDLRHRDRHDEHDYGHGHEGNSQSASCRQEAGMRSIQGDTATQIQFVNTTSREVRLYWLDYKGQRVFYRAIPAGGKYLQPTFKTHPWVLTDQNDRCFDVLVSQQPFLNYNIR